MDPRNDAVDVLLVGKCKRRDPMRRGIERIGILAPGDVKVLRKELVQTIEENQQAVRSDIGPGAVRSLLGGRGTV